MGRDEREPTPGTRQSIEETLNQKEWTLHLVTPDGRPSNTLVTSTPTERGPSTSPLRPGFREFGLGESTGDPFLCDVEGVGGSLWTQSLWVTLPSGARVGLLGRNDPVYWSRDSIQSAFSETRGRGYTGHSDGSGRTVLLRRCTGGVGPGTPGVLVEKETFLLLPSVVKNRSGPFTSDGERITLVPTDLTHPPPPYQHPSP